MSLLQANLWKLHWSLERRVKDKLNCSSSFYQIYHINLMFVKVQCNTQYLTKFWKVRMLLEHFTSCSWDDVAISSLVFLYERKRTWGPDQILFQCFNSMYLLTESGGRTLIMIYDSDFFEGTLDEFDVFLSIIFLLSRDWINLSYLLFFFCLLFKKKVEEKGNGKHKKHRAYTEVSYQLIKTKHRGNCQGLFYAVVSAHSEKSVTKKLCEIWDRLIFIFYRDFVRSNVRF